LVSVATKWVAVVALTVAVRSEAQFQSWQPVIVSGYTNPAVDDQGIQIS